MRNPESQNSFERHHFLGRGEATRMLLSAMLGGIGVVAAEMAPTGAPELRRTVSRGEAPTPKGLDVMGDRELAAAIAPERRRTLAAPALRAAMERPFAMATNV